MKTYKSQISIRTNLRILIFLVLSASLTLQVKAQSTSKNTLLRMIADDRTTIDAIAGYDQNIQRDILQVAQSPELLNKIEELQSRSQNDFRAIIANYDQETQGNFYELARYPNLISDLVRSGRPTVSDVNRIVSNYPQDIHEIAINNGQKYYNVLVRIDQLNNEIDRAFKYALEPYDQHTRQSVNVLIGYPEIVSALVDDKEFTALLGDVYREDPQWVLRNLDKISNDLAEQNREDLDAYKNQIQNDPAAYNEMLDAAERYARDKNEARYLDGVSNPIVDIHVINSYPYWFGYPYWYSNPYWRPLPLCYHTGFYRNHLGAVVFIGLPSFNFIHWQTYYHPTLFPHLSYNYYRYYENHYVTHYRDSHRPVPHHGFYRSIEANVINNPRVNNSTLERIDHQRGSNIVRQPNSMQSGTTRLSRSATSRESTPTYTRPGSDSRVNISRRGNEPVRGNRMEQRNSPTTRQSAGRQQYNMIAPRQPETKVSRGTEAGRGSVRPEAAPSPSRERFSSRRQRASATASENQGKASVMQNAGRRGSANRKNSPQQAVSSENSGGAKASGRRE